MRAREGADLRSCSSVSSGKAIGPRSDLIDTAGRRTAREPDDSSTRSPGGIARDWPRTTCAAAQRWGRTGWRRREFTSVAGVNGIVLTKLDGTAKAASPSRLPPTICQADPLRRSRHVLSRARAHAEVRALDAVPGRGRNAYCTLSQVHVGRNRSLRARISAGIAWRRRRDRTGWSGPGVRLLMPASRSRSLGEVSARTTSRFYADDPLSCSRRR